jgi:hypothetical protein
MSNHHGDEVAVAGVSDPDEAVSVKVPICVK